MQDREAVGPGDDVQQHRRSDRSLVREQLHAVHAEFGVVHSHPNRVYRTANDAAEREDHAEEGRLFAVVAFTGRRVEIRGHRYASADRNKRKDGRPWQRFLVQEEVESGDGRGEEDAADLVEGDGGVREGEVLQNHIQTHCAGQGQHVEEFAPFELEEADPRAREGVEKCGGHEEMVGCEAQLRVFE